MPANTTVDGFTVSEDPLIGHRVVFHTKDHGTLIRYVDSNDLDEAISKARVAVELEGHEIVGFGGNRWVTT